MHCSNSNDDTVDWMTRECTLFLFSNCTESVDWGKDAWIKIITSIKCY